jgi:hypothetical protein
MHESLTGLVTYETAIGFFHGNAPFRDIFPIYEKDFDFRETTKPRIARL